MVHDNKEIKMFIQINENNEIIASADFKFAENAIETDSKVVRNWDGKLVFEGEETVRIKTRKDKGIKTELSRLYLFCLSNI